MFNEKRSFHIKINQIRKLSFGNSADHSFSYDYRFCQLSERKQILQAKPDSDCGCFHCPDNLLRKHLCLSVNQVFFPAAEENQSGFGKGDFRKHDQDSKNQNQGIEYLDRFGGEACGRGTALFFQLILCDRPVFHRYIFFFRP